jgi:hypothetical protein
MGRTIPSFRTALAMEKEEWKPFRNALDKSDRKKFDDMFDIPRLYTSACYYPTLPVFASHLKLWGQQVFQ